MGIIRSAQNETGLDLNRDHVKLEGDSTRAIHRVFSLYQPEVTMDIHEKGDDYYRVSVGCVPISTSTNRFRTTPVIRPFASTVRGVLVVALLL